MRDRLSINLNNYETRIFWTGFVRLSELKKKRKREEEGEEKRKKKSFFNNINDV